MAKKEEEKIMTVEEKLRALYELQTVLQANFHKK